VCRYHWDLPLALQVEEDGWMNPKIVDHFVKYAKLCFSRFGDRVKYWITINEPWCAAVLGHDSGGQHAPGRVVDPSREVYKVAHHMLIAHARTYQMYQ
jgi:beta-glucosidase